MIFYKSLRALLVFIGLLSISVQSLALEVCSQQSCKKAEPQNLDVITENLNRIFGFLGPGDYIQLCKSNPEMTKCVSNDIGYLILGGLILPLRGKITGYKVEKTGDEVSFVADSGKAICGKSKLVFVIEDGTVILKNKNSYYCNWLGVGNVMSYTELKINKVDLDRLHFYGNYKITAIGTAVGAGEGIGSFQVTRGDSVLNSVTKKYGALDLFRVFSASDATPKYTADINKNEAEQISHPKPQSVLSNEKLSERELSVIQERQTESVDRQQAQTLDSGEKSSNSEVLADDKVDADHLATEKTDTGRPTLEKARVERGTSGKARPERQPAEKARTERQAAEKVRSDRLASEKTEAARSAAEKTEAARLAAEKARTERQAAEKPESGRSSTNAPPKNDGKATRPTVNSIMDL